MTTDLIMRVNVRATTINTYRTGLECPRKKKESTTEQRMNALLPGRKTDDPCCVFTLDISTYQVLFSLYYQN